jgi:large subunit ribosomal protein L25
MEKIVLNAKKRDGVGKSAAKLLRKQGLIPAVVYKGGSYTLNLELKKCDLEDILHTKAGANVLIMLKVTGQEKGKDRTVIIKEIQRDPVRDGILHVDFNEISLTETLKLNIPLVAHGEPTGVKKDGGTLEHVIRELHVECLPTAIPEKIEVDVSTLNIGDAVFVKSITAPEGVKILNDPELIAMIVKPPHVEVPKEEMAAVEAAEPELIRKKKEEAPEEAEGAPQEAAKQPKETKEEKS